MQIASIKLITIGTRQRKAFDPESLLALQNSILQFGLLHPIVCREVGGELQLVAGERRLRAINALADANHRIFCNGALLALGECPYILTTNLSDLQAREAELAENILREDLTWQERTAAIAELHTLRKEQNATQTFQQTAQEISPTRPSARQEVSRATILADYIDDPEINKARDEKEAFNILSRRMQMDYRKELMKLETRESPHTLILGDLAPILRTKLERASFDLVIADPPYGIDAGNFRGAAKMKHKYEDTKDIAFDIAHVILCEGIHICREEAHVFMFCDIDMFCELRDMATTFGWTPSRTPIVWEKGSQGHLTAGLLGFRRSYELILFASKGKKTLTQLSLDVIRIPAAMHKQHAAEKPVALYEHLMRISCDPGGHVLDPCCGSGTIFPAADSLKLTATGVELDEEAYYIAQERLESLTEMSTREVEDG